MMSFATVLFFYFLAEISVALVDVARRLEQQAATTGAPASAAAECPRCGASMESDSEFCDQCGAGRTMAARV
jgi:ribosomal protein S27AE